MRFHRLISKLNYWSCRLLIQACNLIILMMRQQLSDYIKSFFFHEIFPYDNCTSCAIKITIFNDKRKNIIELRRIKQKQLSS